MRLTILFIALSVLLLFTKEIYAQQVFMQKGTASFYADHFQGRQTANGDRYNKNELTAAHKTLSFGSKVKVTNLENQKSVIVTINDRGPFIKGRIIDLSRKAAEALDIVRAGTGKVEIEVIEGSEVVEENLEQLPESDEKLTVKFNNPGLYLVNGEAATLQGYAVQVAAFNQVPNAIRFVYTLEKLGITDIRLEVSEDKVIRILAGGCKNRHSAEKLLTKLKSEGYGGIIKGKYS
jgi:rare lipoprotein A